MIIRKTVKYLFIAPDDLAINLVKLLVIPAVLTASVLLGFIASPKWALLSIVLVFGCIGIIILIRHPEIGIYLLIPISFFAPWEVGTGTNVSLNMTFLFSILIIGIWIVNLVATKTKIPTKLNLINKLSILFIVATCLSLLAGSNRWVINAQEQASLPAQLAGWLLYVLPVGIMLYTQAHVKNIRQLKIIVWLFIGIGSLYIFSNLLPSTYLQRFHLFAPRSTEAMFWIWLTALVFGQTVCNKEINNRYRFLLGILTIAIILLGISEERNSWVSGWLPPLLAIATILWLYNWKLGLSISMIGLIVFGISRLSSFANSMTSLNDYSIYSRAATYPIMFDLIKANPITGLGFANYSHYTSLYPILGWYVSFNSHSNYVDIIAQTGFVGLGLFLLLVLAISLRGWKLRKFQMDGFSKGYVYACLGGIVGMLFSGFLGDWFLPYLYNIGIPGFRTSIYAWIFLGGLLALGNIVEKQNVENAPTVIS